MRRILQAGLAIGILAMALAFPAPSAFADSPDDELDSLTAVRVLTDMLAAHDYAPAIDLFDEDLVFVKSPQAIGGKDEALAWLDSTDYADIELCDVWLDDEFVTWTVRVYEIDTIKIEIASAVVYGGKIIALKALR